MSTTSLKLPGDLKARAAAAAQELGLSPHAFMVDAIEQAASAAQQRADFLQDARASWQEALASGKGFAAADVHAYLDAKLHGQPAQRPRAKPWRK